MAHTRHARLGLTIATIAIASIALTGCVQGSKTPGSHPSASHGSHTPTAPSASPTATATATATPPPTGPRVTTTCDRILTSDQAYAFNPNVVVDTGYSPKPGSLPATMKANGALACGWINETSRVELEVTVTIGTAPELAAAKAAAANGASVHTDSADLAYFAVSGGVGTAQLFQGSYWVAVSSADFQTGDDASSIYDVVMNNLRTAGG
jgi:hypothetical protein